MFAVFCQFTYNMSSNQVFELVNSITRAAELLSAAVSPNLQLMSAGSGHSATLVRQIVCIFIFCLTAISTCWRLCWHRQARKFIVKMCLNTAIYFYSITCRVVHGSGQPTGQVGSGSHIKSFLIKLLVTYTIKLKVVYSPAVSSKNLMMFWKDRAAEFAILSD